MFDQSVLLEHVRLRLHVNRIVGTRGRRRIDVAKVEEIVVDALDLDRSLGLVYTWLGDANRAAAMMPKNAIHNKVALRRYSVRAHSMTLHSWPLGGLRERVSRSGDGSPGGMWIGHGSASSKQNQLS